MDDEEEKKRNNTTEITVQPYERHSILYYVQYYMQHHLLSVRNTYLSIPPISEL